MFNALHYRGFHSIALDQNIRFFCCDAMLKEEMTLPRLMQKPLMVNDLKLQALNNNAWELMTCYVAGIA